VIRHLARELIAKLGYTVGFIVVILSRQQLFTENTLTPILSLPAVTHNGFFNGEIAPVAITFSTDTRNTIDRLQPAASVPNKLPHLGSKRRHTVEPEPENHPWRI
jgi:hypothetical protein